MPTSEMGQKLTPDSAGGNSRQARCRPAAGGGGGRNFKKGKGRLGVEAVCLELPTRGCLPSLAKSHPVFYVFGFVLFFKFQCTENS